MRCDNHNKELKKLYLAYLNEFGIWPDGYEDYLNIKLLDEELQIKILVECLKRHISFPSLTENKYWIDS